MLCSIRHRWLPKFRRRTTARPAVRLAVRPLEDRLAPAVFVVDSLLDENDGDISAGKFSLREAVGKANAEAGPDTITFAAGLTGTITLALGDLSLNDAVTISGPGADKLTVSGNNATRLFVTTAAPAAAAIIVESIALTQGNGIAGAFLVGDESLILRKVAVTNNKSVGGGGAIFVSPGGLVLIEDSKFSGNQTATGPADGGGAVAASGAASITVRRSTLSGNTAPRGGALFGQYGASIVVEQSTLSGNAGTGAGGGAVYFFGGATRFEITNSTLSGNQATTGAGGAVRLNGFGGTAKFTNVTIAKNTAATQGGGLDGPVTLVSTLVADNAAPAGPDIAGSASATQSLIENTGGVTITGTGNVTGADPLLTPLVNFGGPTAVHALKAGSPAIDAGDNPLSLATDQRGPGFPRTVGAATDIGAFEGVAPTEPVSFVVNLATDTVDATDFKTSLREALAAANADKATADTITFDPSVFAAPTTIPLVNGQLSILGPVTIAGPAAKVTLDANKAGRIFHTAGAATKAAITIQDVTLTGGRAFGGAALFIGDEAVTLRRVLVHDNDLTGGQTVSGAVLLEGSAGLLVEDSTFTDNDCSRSAGGAICGTGNTHIVIRRSTFRNNTAASGGAIAVFEDTLLIEDSTLSGNTSVVVPPQTGGGSGGAIYAYNSSVTVVNCTISGNTAVGTGSVGGGVYMGFPSTAAVFRNTTVIGNAAETGGGIAVIGTFSGTKVALESTIVAGNTAATGPDLATNAKSPLAVGGSNSLLGVADVGNFTLTGAGNLTGTKATPLDPQLLPLADNGGPTQTHALKATSPALDAGNNALIPSGVQFDQRGPGFARVFGKAVDVGALEVQTAPAAAKVNSVVINDGAAQRSVVTTLAVTFSEVVTLPTDPVTAFKLERSGPGMPTGALTLLKADTSGSTGTNTVVTLTWAGDPTFSQFGSLIDGRYTLTVFAASVNGGNFDGNGDGTPGDDFVLIGNPANNTLYRLFGDSNGDGKSDFTDFLAFRSTFGLSKGDAGFNPAFDADGNGTINNDDFLVFRNRFGSEV